MTHRRRPRRATAALVTLVTLAALPVALAPAAAGQTSGEAAPEGFEVAGREAVAPGVEHLLVRRSAPQQEVHVARIAPSVLPRLRVMASWDRVGGSPRYERTTSMCLRVRCVVAVNGDFSDLATAQVVGPLLTGGELLRTPSMRHGRLSVLADGRLEIGHGLDWQAAVDTDTGRRVDLGGVNVARTPGAIVLYTMRFGPSTGTGPDGIELVAEVGGPLGHEGTPLRPLELRQSGDTPITSGTVVLSGSGAGAAALQELWSHLHETGASAALTVDARGAREAIGGSPVLLRDRQWAFPDTADSFTAGRHPRTAVGWTATGELLMVTVDGRQPGYSEGMSLRELADLLIGLGAVEALNLDGGGSTSFVVNSRLRNRPSDAGNTERGVTSALVLVPPPGAVATAQPRGTDGACPPGSVPSPDFGDVVASNPHRATIDCAVWWGVSSGRTASSYEPSRTLTRAQLATLLARTIVESGGTLPPVAPNRFADDDSSPHAGSIDRVAAAGIMGGRADGTFGPDLPVSRAQLATALARAVEYRTGGALAPTADYFADDEGIAHEPSINKVAFGGMVSGVHLNLYAPADGVRRDTVATFVARALDLLVEQVGARPPGSSG